MALAGSSRVERQHTRSTGLPRGGSTQNVPPPRRTPVPVRKEAPAPGLKLVDVTESQRQTDLFEELAMPLFAQLYNFAHWLTQSRDEAEDLVQETYAKALRGFSSFQQGTNFRAWMYRILRNSFLNSRTGLKTAVEFDEEEHGGIAADERSSPEQMLLERAQRE